MGGGQVFVHLGEPRGWRRSSNRPWPQRPMSQWLTRRSLRFKKNVLKEEYKTMPVLFLTILIDLLYL
ncbi:hypothetical protein Hanom_Chr16g01516271 [Helianthus anomalus]